MTALCGLAVQWGCDKAPAIRHGYTPFYHRLLAGRRIERVLEIGVYQGASLRMWRDYWPHAGIFGLDIDPAALFNEGGIQTRLCDAGDAGQLTQTAVELGGNFDLIVDDGSHRPNDQIVAVNALLPFLTPTGIYVIEDVSSPGELSARIPFPHQVHAFDSPLAKRFADDDNLIVIDKAP